ncbi:MAG: DUF7005 family protein [Bacillota bacterium]
MQKLDFRKKVLQELGASAGEIEEVLEYTSRHFKHPQKELELPLANEAHIPVWEDYVQEAEEKGVFATLQDKLVQFSFPIQNGISKQDYYKDVTLRGKDSTTIEQAVGLELEQPEQLKLTVAETIAGKVPLLIVKHRPDFIKITQAIAYKNEPYPIPDSMGATMIAGYNNWDRIHLYKTRWLENNSIREWKSEFKKLIKRKELYQDKLIIVSAMNYSAISAAQLNLSAQQWQEYSLQIRIAHESTHYLANRVLGGMETHVVDELIADYWGITTAVGHYKVDWFFKFMGLDSKDKYRAGGRLENYVDQTKISKGSFKLLIKLVRNAAHNLAEFDKKHLAEGNNYKKVLVLTHFTLEELASEKGVELLDDCYKGLTG